MSNLTSWRALTKAAGLGVVVRALNLAARLSGGVGAVTNGLRARCVALANRADEGKTRALLDARERRRRP